MLIHGGCGDNGILRMLDLWRKRVNESRVILDRVWIKKFGKYFEMSIGCKKNNIIFEFEKERVLWKVILEVWEIISKKWENLRF